MITLGAAKAVTMPVQVGSYKVVASFNQDMAVVGVTITAFDGDAVLISGQDLGVPPPPTEAQLAAINATTALADETFIAWVERACAPYVLGAYNLP